jgi:hypothetical protein
MAIVYQHKRKDTQEVFYIGIGKSEKRAYDKNRRYKPWKDFVKNHEYYVEITHKDIIWEEACSIEKYLIAFYGRRDLGQGSLVNMTDGGEGTKNLSQESRSKMAVNKGMFGELNYFYGKKHEGDLSRFGKQNIGREPWMKGKKHEGDLSRFGIQNIGKESQNKGLICINNTITNKYIKQNLLEDYIKNGWSLGSKKRKQL